MKSLDIYRDFIKETRGQELVKTARGFATYSLDEGIAFIENIYISKDHRRSDAANELADLVVDKTKCRQLLGQCDVSISNPEISVMCMIKYGFKFYKAENNIMYLFKDIK